MRCIHTHVHSMYIAHTHTHMHTHTTHIQREWDVAQAKKEAKAIAKERKSAQLSQAAIRAMQLGDDLLSDQQVVRSIQRLEKVCAYVRICVFMCMCVCVCIIEAVCAMQLGDDLLSDQQVV